jgi:hypothetical protein
MPELPHVTEWCEYSVLELSVWFWRLHETISTIPRILGFVGALLLLAPNRLRLQSSARRVRKRFESVSVFLTFVLLIFSPNYKEMSFSASTKYLSQWCFDNWFTFSISCVFFGHVSFHYSRHRWLTLKVTTEGDSILWQSVRSIKSGGGVFMAKSIAAVHVKPQFKNVNFICEAEGREIRTVILRSSKIRGGKILQWP